MTLAAALNRLEQADQQWFAALDAHITAPPNHDFARRLRALAQACESQRRALEYGASEGLEWNPLPAGTDRPPPYELRPQSGRVGPVELWRQFDDAYERFNRALEGRSLEIIAGGFGEIADIAERLADAVAEERESGEHQAQGRRSA